MTKPPQNLPEFTDLDLFLRTDIFPDTLGELEDVLSGKAETMEQYGNTCTLVADKNMATITAEATYAEGEPAPVTSIETAKLKVLIEKYLKLDGCLEG